MLKRARIGTLKFEGMQHRNSTTGFYRPPANLLIACGKITP